ncbi:CCA tRNA nucleotidyltransferase [Ferrovibrio xuzhouensis]|uniref:CCA tRNA nucleotidyltransferase n=1 Tax=Ferrovibrio xuzhouensis TaxID=1576914 RepID=A0ABV7VK56_9PROT
MNTTLPDSLPESLPGPLPDWMATAETRRLFAALVAGGGTAPRFVGGCVRDAILGLAPADIDLATPETPEVVVRRLRAAGLKAVPTGIAHGTVTAVVPPALFQITTLRRDVATDGRHAEVAFAADGTPESWAADARRRDFTINALYADADGRLHDFTDGRADLAAGIVRFIGDPAARVTEDYLRVLRFFRFHARFGRGAPDAASLMACAAAAAAGQLARLSGERVRDELLKILALPNAAEALALMSQAGVLAALLPDARFDAMAVARLVALQQQVAAAGGIEPEVWPRLALLFSPAEAGRADAVADRLKLSNAQRLRLDGLLTPLPLDWAAVADDEAFRQALYRHGAERCRDHVLLAAVDDPARYALAQRRLAEATAWRRPVFPVRGADLLALGFPPSPTISGVLKELEAWWAADGFRADRETCLQRLQMQDAAEADDGADSTR